MSPYQAWPFLSDPAHPLLSALWAVLARGVVALVAVGPIVRRSRHPLGYAVVAFAAASLIDLDHFIAAGSLSLHRIETLGDRPDTHSLAFVALLSLLALALTRRPLFAWSVLAIDTAHLLFDGAGGHEQILYPFSHLDGIPWLLCPLGTLALALASFALARRGAGTARAPASTPPQRADGPILESS